MPLPLGIMPGMNAKKLSVLGLAAVVAAGCATNRTVTLTTTPIDANLKINNADRGHGPVTEKFVFAEPNDVYYVTASRKGFQDQTAQIKTDTGPSVNIALKPYVRRISIVSSPVPAIISVDGRPLTAEPLSAISSDVEFTVDAKDDWVAHTITAERTGFLKAEQQVTWDDQSTLYTLKLDPMRKDLRIYSNPPGARATLDDKDLGVTPLVDKQRPFEFDTTADVNTWVEKTLRVTKAGYDPIERKISWDAGQNDYTIDLIPKHKTVHLLTNPPGATVTIEGVDVHQESGAAAADLTFPPVNDHGDLKTFKAHITKKTDDAEWYPQDVTLAWDEGRTDYPIKLREVMSQTVPATTLNMQRTNGEWSLAATATKSMAMKFVTEPDGEQPTQVVQLPKGQTVGSVSVSPDGQYVVYSVVGQGQDGPTSQMFRVRTDGTGGSTSLSDGRSVDLTPAFTAAGDNIVFSSNRAGRKFSVWSISAAGTGGVTRYTSGDTNDLWPGVDASAKPRLFYQAYIDTRSDPRLYVVQVGTPLQTDLTTLGGEQPKVSPRNDAVVYTSPNEKTGKHDLYKVSDKGGAPESLTSDSDNINPVWNANGNRIAFASDRGKEAEDGRSNYDIYTLDPANPSDLKQVTKNGSVDDLPAFDPSGDAIYFRSNRGGAWGIWKIAVR